uniref:hypothetical protein n=1 Tax=uncultured Erythrobacter sp. TaxID=263913 RepID=UPI00261A96ED|nr:hypothetical protein [uncultured Erythrobacter sp.]
MIGRLIWYAALLLVAAVTAALQLDRQSASIPALSKTVPPPARGFAQAQIAARALRAEEANAAVEEAKLLVERRPIPAESLRLLAQAQFAAGQTDEGFLTIQIAAKRGWRDPAAQEAMLRLALAAGDEAEAAKRYTALFLQNRTEDALLIELGATLFAPPDSPATQTLIDIVSGSERWPDTFLRRGIRVLPADAFVKITNRAIARNASFTCGSLNDVSAQLMKRDQDTGRAMQAVIEGRC